jgi:acyl-CoA dehydrogenase
MDFALDDEQQLITATVRRMVDKQLRDWAADADRDGAPPDRLLEVAGEVGFLVDAVPEAAGGTLEDDYHHLTRALRGIELGRGCAAFAALLEANVEPALAVGARGSDAARAALFGSLAGGGLAATVTDLTGALTVEARGGDLVVTGTAGPVPVLAAADHALVCAPHAGEPALLLLATAAATVEPVTPSGWRAARWGRLQCDGAVVPADFVLARGDAAVAAADQVLTWYRLSLAARAVGVAASAMANARGYAAERIQFGQPIGSFESIARLRDTSETATRAARALTLEAAWKVDRGAADAADAASRARDFACQVMTTATIDAVQIYGGYGFVNDYPVEKQMRDARPFDLVCGSEPLERVLAIKEAV